MIKIEYKTKTEPWIENIANEIKDKLMNTKTTWGYSFDIHKENFLLGTNINIGKYYNKKYYGYICIYLGFRTLSIGKDYWD
jgi:hypothetical protein